MGFGGDADRVYFGVVPRALWQIIKRLLATSGLGEHLSSECQPAAGLGIFGSETPVPKRRDGQEINFHTSVGLKGISTSMSPITGTPSSVGNKINAISRRTFFNVRH